jgi:hypothetical protein
MIGGEFVGGADGVAPGVGVVGVDVFVGGLGGGFVRGIGLGRLGWKRFWV